MLLGPRAVGQKSTLEFQGLPENPGSQLSYIAAFGDYVLIVGDDGHHGEEPWVYAPKSGTMRLLRDIYEGLTGSGISEFEVVGDRLFFAAAAVDTGHELWCTDGTIDGTRLVRDIRPGRTAGSNPSTFSRLGDQLLFLANDGEHDIELWVSDGSTAGTHIVKDIHPEDLDSRIVANGTTFEPVPMGDIALFRAVPVGEEGQLWRTDGTEEGTYHVETPGVYLDGYLTQIAGFEEFALFTGIGKGTGVELWRTDGTTAGTHLVRDINNGPTDSSASEFATMGGRLFFQAQDAEFGNEIWMSDGTNEGTQILKDIIPGPGGSNPYPFRVSGSQLFFTALTEDTGRELWVSDGTTEGTRMVLDIAAGPKSGKPYSIFPSDGGIFFSAERSDIGEELWFSDGTAGGTRLVKDIHPGPESSEPYSLQVLNGVAYFEANDGVHGGELWRSDGTANGTYMVADLYRPGPEYYSANPTDLIPVGNSLAFVARTSDRGRLWHRTDGTAAGTAPWDEMGTPRSAGRTLGVPMAEKGTLIAFESDENGPVVYHAKDHVGGRPKSDAANPFLMVFEEYDDDEISEMALAGDSIFVKGNDGLRRLDIDGGRLWEVKSTVEIHEIHSLHSFSTGVVFAATSEEHGEELWYASRDEITLVSDIYPGSESSSPGEFTLVQDQLFFVANDGVQGREVWKLESAGAEPSRVTSLSSNRRPSSGNPGGLVACNGVLYFAATDDIHGRELWSTDGSEEGTRLVADIFKGAPSSYPEELTAVGDKIFFRAEAYETGAELFGSDGTTAGTFLVADKAAGYVDFQPRELTEFDGTLFMVARGTAGDGRPIESTIWYVEGGLLKVLTVASSEPGAQPKELTVVGDQLFFSSFNTSIGRELWVVSRTAGADAYTAECVVDLFSPRKEIAIAAPDDSD
jgi:ELWxxDGT repeat protein